MATKNAINSNIPIEISKGGTNATSMTTTDGVVYYDGTRLVTTAVGTATHVLTSNGAGSAPTFQAAGGGGLEWEAATANKTLEVNKGYLTIHGTPANLLTYTLPATSSVGDVCRIAGYTVGGWKLEQAAGQQIYFGSQNTTAGAGGSLASSASKDSIEIVCVVADTIWVIISSIGNITIV